MSFVKIIPYESSLPFHPLTLRFLQGHCRVAQKQEMISPVTGAPFVKRKTLFSPSFQILLCVASQGHYILMMAQFWLLS